jgi:colicin import membrane protein
VERISWRLGTAGAALILAVGAALAPMAIGQPLSDKAAAQQILTEMAHPLASSSAEPALTRAPIEEAKRALDRAAGARRSGDVRHAEMLEGLAREWAETARDVVRAVAVEADAGALEMAAADAGIRAERSRALLEEAIARRGRAEAELEKLSTDAGIFPVQPSSLGGARSKPSKAPRPASSAPAKEQR